MDLSHSTLFSLAIFHDALPITIITIVNTIINQ